MKIIDSVEAALASIAAAEAPTDFGLALADALQDPYGINMAIITDRILAKGWMPDGFTQDQGFRVYRYRQAADS